MCAGTPQGHDDAMTNSSIIALRASTAADGDALRELAQLDSARPLHGPALLAVVDGRPVAAASLRDGRVVADPFVPTEDVVGLLRARVAALEAPRRRRRAWSRVPRLRPAA